MLEFDLIKRFRNKKRVVEIKAIAQLDPSKITAFYGASGVGKSTVLRMLAGLSQPDEGYIQRDGVFWFDAKKKINLPAVKRKVGFVFQDYNLFPGMTVKKNLEYAAPDGKVPQDIAGLIDTLGLHTMMEARPHELSGGQRQRVAILRSLCHNPQVLFLDEPFSALDDEAIAAIIQEIKIIHESRNTLICMVSHRKDVIFDMAGEVVHFHADGSTSQGAPTAMLTRSF